MILVCGGLSVGIYYIVFSMKDTYVNPSTGLMMVKAPEGSTDTNTAGIFELPARTLGQGVTITSQGQMGGRTCYSSDSVANMFVNVATGVTTSLVEKDQETGELHVYHLGNSDCDESTIMWSNEDVQLGCVVMIPNLECTNMVRRGRYLSEFVDTDTDAMQDHHRSLKEHVANTIVGAATGGQHGTTIHRSNRNIGDFGGLSYVVEEEPRTIHDILLENAGLLEMNAELEETIKELYIEVEDLFSCQETVVDLSARVAVLEASLGPATSPTMSPNNRPTKLPTVGSLIGEPLVVADVPDEVDGITGIIEDEGVEENLEDEGAEENLEDGIADPAEPLDPDDVAMERPGTSKTILISFLENS